MVSWYGREAEDLAWQIDDATYISPPKGLPGGRTIRQKAAGLLQAKIVTFDHEQGL